MKLSLIRRRNRNTLKIEAEEPELEDLNAAVQLIRQCQPMQADGAWRIAKLLVDCGYEGTLTKNTRFTKEWTLRKESK